MKTSKKRKIGGLALAGMFALSAVLSGCNSGASKEAASGTPSAPSTALEMKDGKYDPPVSITYLRPWGPDVKFKSGEDQDNNVHTKWAKDKLGIELKNQWVSPSTNNAFETKLRLSLASNAEMPDIISYRGEFNLVRELIETGKFVDAGELFDKYASDTWKAAVNEDPSVWYPYMQDGKRIGIPILDYSYNGDPVMWIREDWMKKFNLQAPKTLADLEVIMETFTNKDPDGNGKKDTYGLTIGFKNWLNTWMSDAGWIFGAYGTMPNQWNLKDDGTLEYGSVNAGAKQALATLHDWMSKGYIPEEAGVYDETKAAEEFTAGKAGIVVGPHWMPAWPLEDVKKNNPEAEYKAYPIPSGPDGKAGRHGTSNGNGVILINKDMKNPEAFFTYQNYLFDNYANPKAGGEFEHGFAEGYDWAMKDGKPTTDASVTGGFAPEKYTLTFDGARIPSLSMTTLAKLANGEEATTPFEKKMQTGVPQPMLEAAKIVLDQKDIVMNQMFTGSPTMTMQMNNDILTKMEKDTFSQIIYGKAPIDAFDTFVEKWKSSGGDQSTKEVNEWYQSVTSGK
ncbi:extracellular solute-binding protein [Paenibacillus barcinonensis]|uniref:Extracellular solute-binding protein n=1 Tax=Paenibacillus barcinonensis TaxID=198119 RepID=A0A2V4V6B4_PAEBA|nr:extracellular solute-binding protein [Paenibacillus barcinonensis]PYE48007.1 putative aldouronate transport system substrate-binding protein [Paenibacillus barcinonensis]QKS55126.1 extracellular solute-binding protein [Paenibacillus barcinonensis]